MAKRRLGCCIDEIAEGKRRLILPLLTQTPPPEFSKTAGRKQTPTVSRSFRRQTLSPIYTSHTANAPACMATRPNRHNHGPHCPAIDTTHGPSPCQSTWRRQTHVHLQHMTPLDIISNKPTGRLPVSPSQPPLQTCACTTLSSAQHSRPGLSPQTRARPQHSDSAYFPAARRLSQWRRR